MYRMIEENFLKWKKQENHKPLLISGSRQVGKTYSILNFAKKHYLSYVYINFERDDDIRAFFEQTSKPEEIMMNLQVFFPEADWKAKEILVILDEIQACPQALTSIKFLGTETPYDYILSGSLLGVAVNRTSSYPVGYVESMEMQPMGFMEFLYAVGLKAEHISYLKECYTEKRRVNEGIHKEYMKHFRNYIITGGMPEAVKTFVETGDFVKTRNIQQQIVEGYYRDMAKYADASEKIRTHECFRSIPLQLAKENKKFQYKLVRKGGQAAHFENSLQWLKDSGTISFCYRLQCIDVPMEAYKESSVYKIYMSDTGLLLSQFKETVMQDILKNELGVYKGAIYENIVAQMLTFNKYSLHYFEPSSHSEIDFIIEQDCGIVPIEVKSSMNTRARSLKAYIDKYEPKRALRFSIRNLNISERIEDYPLYMLMFGI